MQNKNTPDKDDCKDNTIPLFCTYPMTNFEPNPNPDKTAPLVSDDNVLRAKKFVDQNHK